MKKIQAMINAMESRWRNRMAQRETRGATANEVCPPAEHDFPHLGDRLER